MAYAGAPLAQPATTAPRATLPQQASPRARVALGLAGPQQPAQTGMAMGGMPSQMPQQSPFGGMLQGQGQYGLGMMGMPFGTVPQTPGQIDPWNRFRGGGGGEIY